MSGQGKAAQIETVGARAAGLAHDFNNLLTEIVASADVALACQPTNREVRAELRRIRLAAEHGGSMVRRLLSTGAAPPELRRMRLDSAVAASVPGLRRLAGPSVQLDVVLEGGDRQVLLDPDDLQAALRNLTVNARDAMPRGGALRLHTYLVVLAKPLRAQPAPMPAGPYAVIELRDTGTGMSAALKKRVCEPFFTTKGEGRGSGLGLPAVCEKALRHGGALTIASRQGQGTTVRLYLPPCDEPPAIRPAREPNAPGVPSVLLVEDEPALRRLQTRLLAGGGWHVTAAADGKAALDSLRSTSGDPPALLVCDVALPGLDGPSVIRAARRLYPGLPAILVSGDTDTMRPPDLPDVAWLGKPFRAAALLTLASRLVVARVEA
jgi:two-component system, cell cycle sensor histidine kinase and response regulator CckA